MRLIKQIIVLFTSVCFLVTAPLAQAIDLNNAFNSLVANGNMNAAINKPGHFQSGARHIFSAGGVDVRMPRTQVSLFSITPPSISAGCGGVSAYFGGFSFISGEQIQALVKNIAQGAVGFVIHLAIKTLCPMCEAVIELMQKLAQAAAKMSMDSCAIGEQLGQMIGDKMGLKPPPDFARNVCGQDITAPSSNNSDDFLGTLDGICKSVEGAFKKIQEGIMGKPEGPARTDEAMKKAHVFGNQTWQALKALGYRPFGGEGNLGQRADMVLLLNLMGTTINGFHDNNPDGTAKLGEWQKPMLSADDSFKLLMCGAADRGDIDYPYGEDYCSQFWGNGALKIWTCDEFDQCLKLQEIDLNASGISTGVGLLFKTHTALKKGVIAVATNTELPTSTIGLIQAVPLPLYQAINVGAVYPSAALQLVDAMTVMVSQLIAKSYLDQILKGVTSTVAPSQIDPRLIARVSDLMATFIGLNNDRIKQMTSSLTMMELVNSQISDLNKAIQREVLTYDLIGAQAFSTGLMTTLGNHSRNTNAGTSANPTNPE